MHSDTPTGWTRGWHVHAHVFLGGIIDVSASSSVAQTMHSGDEVVLPSALWQWGLCQWDSHQLVHRSSKTGAHVYFYLTLVLPGDACAWTRVWAHFVVILFVCRCAF